MWWVCMFWGMEERQTYVPTILAQNQPRINRHPRRGTWKIWWSKIYWYFSFHLISSLFVLSHLTSRLCSFLLSFLMAISIHAAAAAVFVWRIVAPSVKLSHQAIHPDYNQDMEQWTGDRLIEGQRLLSFMPYYRSTILEQFLYQTIKESSLSMIPPSQKKQTIKWKFQIRRCKPYYPAVQMAFTWCHHFVCTIKQNKKPSNLFFLIAVHNY